MPVLRLEDRGLVFAKINSKKYESVKARCCWLEKEGLDKKERPPSSVFCERKLPITKFGTLPGTIEEMELHLGAEVEE